MLFLLVVLSLTMVWFVETSLAFPLTTGMVVIYGLICSFLFVPFVLLDRSPARILLIACFYFGMVAIHLVPWNARKPFWRDLRTIRPGMTVEQVDAIMEQWVIDPFPTNVHNMVFRDGEDFILYRPGVRDGRFREDYGLVRFQEGRVRSVYLGK